MDVLVLIGRILFVLLFLNSAIGHLTQTKAMAGYAQARGVPAATAATFGSGVLLLLGSLSVVLGVWADLGALLLFAFLLPTAVMMHAFWKEADGQARQMEMIQFFKDLSLAGACLMVLAFVAYVGDELGLVITGPLFDLG
ncbi:DoxX family membrane protein [Streptomyces sp. GC420]|uniref:DoxX family membrane protein n=1 Tax=Streptomyces sp. GC420 TaxID=2697568 RepID=UPI001414FF18|nr:DoxX family membrane protein [Streptomyces sp. GC420]NBM18641.1 DoxX family membrane protein [Streptomyces sp. GC420]